MNITIRTEGTPLSAAAVRQVEHRLHVALRRFAGSVVEVVATIRDVNGPRGGRDKQGQAVITLWRGAPLVVKALEESVPLLVAQLATASRSAVKSHLARRATRPLRQRRRTDRLRRAAKTAAAAGAESIAI